MVGVRSTRTLPIGRISKSLTLAATLGVTAYGATETSLASAAGVGFGLSSPFELYLGPGFNPPEKGAVGWGVSQPFDLYLGPAFIPAGGGSVGSAYSPPFAIYLGPGFRPPSEAGIGYALSSGFDLYLGRLHEGSSASAGFELDTRTPDQSFVTAPTDLVAYLGTCGSTVQLQWSDDAVDNTGFQLEAKVHGFPDIWYERIATPAADARSFLHQPNDGLARTYRVRAVRGQAISVYSNEASAPAPGLPGQVRAPAGLVVKSIGDGVGLRLHIMPPEGTTQWDGVSVVQIEQATSPDFDHDRILTKRWVFDGTGGRTLRFEGQRDRPDYFRAQIIPPCAQPSAFAFSDGVAPRYAPVLLVHGIWGSPSSWGDVWSNALASGGFSAERIRKAGFTHCGDTWMAWGEELRTTIIPHLLSDGGAWGDDESVDIIAHSQGGLAARYYVERRGGASKVRTVVMIATPNHGGSFATFSSFLYNAGVMFPGCTPISASRGVRALGSNSTSLRTLNFGNDRQHDGGCEDTPDEQINSRKGAVEYYTIAGTGPSVLYCNPLNPIFLYCQWKEIRDEDPGTCASDGIVKAQSVYLRALSADHQFRDVDIGAGGTVHSGPLEVPPHSRPILESQEIAQWAVGLLRRPNAHDAAAEGIPASTADASSMTSARILAPSMGITREGFGSTTELDSLTLLASATDSIMGGGARSYNAACDTISQLMVFGAWQDSILSLQLRGPDSAIYAPADTVGRPWLHYESNDDLAYAAFAVDNPSPGTWAVEVAAPSGTYMSHFDIDWIAKGGAFRLSAGVDKDVLQPADTLTLFASLLRGASRVDAECSASVVTPMGTNDFIALYDDGSAADSLPSDGVHTGRFVAPLSDGGYEVHFSGRVIGEGLSPAVRSSVTAFSVISGPDLELHPNALRAAPALSSVGRLTELSLMIHNRGFSPTDSSDVLFEDISTGESLGVSRVQIPARDSIDARILWTPQVAGEHTIRASTVLLGSVEGNVSNNEADLLVPIAAMPQAVGVDTARVLPARFEFAAPRPNPFRNVVNFDFTVPRSARVSIEIFDVQGRRVRRLLDTMLSPGRYTRLWDGNDATGRAALSGVYFVQLRAPAYVLTRRAVLIR